MDDSSLFLTSFDYLDFAEHSWREGGKEGVVI